MTSLRRYAQLIEDAPAVEAIRAEAEAKRAFYRGEWAQAISAYGRWLQIEPDNVEARFELAQSYDSTRQPVLAKQTYGELLSYFPPHRQAHAAYDRLERRRAVSVQPFAEAQSADGYHGQRGDLGISDSKSKSCRWPALRRTRWTRGTGKIV